MLLAAVGDIHAPKYLSMFEEAVSRLGEKPDMLALLGDLIYRGQYQWLKRVVEVAETIGCPMIAVPGNEEFSERRFSSEMADHAIVLNDTLVTVRAHGIELCIVGTKGSLDKPTSWQARNIPGIAERYRRRATLVCELAKASRAQVKVLLSHYAPTYRTMRGEPPSIYPQLGSRMLENCLKAGVFDAAIHAHVHRGKPSAQVGSCPVYNVSLPCTREVSLIELKPAMRKAGLELFIG
ncbi:MAG: metallophosphoesterase [Thermoproteota archaeon]|nr:MAG: metallophosphoesterase [Candidatus Korarchaeota archaeon]RLG55346.1 MAG: metallophosphoesterase [Candidatus Korarchaeota archaeon]